MRISDWSSDVCSSDLMAYAKYVRGYRQGNVILAADPGIDTFEPEHVNSYEIGLKTTYRGMIPGRFNIAAVYNDLTNQQLQYGYVSPTAQIGRAQVRTPVNTSHLVCRPLLEKKKNKH